MKKIALLTVLILMFVFSVTPLAATETYQEGVQPDIYWNDGETLTWGSGDKTYSSPAGVLPTNGSYMNSGTGAPNTGIRFRCYEKAVAKPEYEGSDNVVFELTTSAVLTDVSVKATSPVRRHSATTTESSAHIRKKSFLHVFKILE